MTLLATVQDFSLPFKNPVVIFSLVLFIILLAPILLNKLRVPSIIGLILAGVLIGPYGLNLLLRDSSIVLFGTVGLLYIMFTAGLEIDMEEFKRNRVSSLVFGLYTFLVPMTLGSLAAYHLLDYDWLSSILLASMFASHTLLTYPTASKYGIARIRSVTLTIGGTIITDILALLVLAAVIGMTKGEITTSFWLRLIISSIIFGLIIFLVFPIIARFFFRKVSDDISQYIFVLAMVFLGSFLAEVAGLEAIVGAFLSGLSLNRFIPHSSALMNRIEFVGNAIFIPFFLIGVGMLIDFNVLFKGLEALKVAAVMIVLAIITKYIASWLTQKTFKLSSLERKMIFGLSNARVGATLAIVLVGYNFIVRETETGEPIRLLSEDVLNGTILMILVTCTISSFVTEKASRKLAIKEGAAEKPEEKESDRYLVSLAYPETVIPLVDLALTLKPRKSKAPVFALHVTGEQDAHEKNHSEEKKMLEQAVKRGASHDETITPLSRYDINISHGIIYTIKEHSITDLIIGLHHNAGASNFLGPIVDDVVHRSFGSIYLYKAAQPINTLNRMVVLVPSRAEYEKGFVKWFEKIYTIAKEAGFSIAFYASRRTIERIKRLNANKEAPLQASFNEFVNWEEFLIFSREVKENDLFIIIGSRRGYLSYMNEFDKVSNYLTKYFTQNSFMIIYPEQYEGEEPKKGLLGIVSSH